MLDLLAQLSWPVLGVIALALVFDFINGMHDAANSIATIVSTRVMRPHWAVLWAAFFNFIAFLIFGTKVAATIGKGVVSPDPGIVTLPVVAAGLVGAIFWDMLTWWWGIPSSSSHALVGGFAGAAVANAGFKALVTEGLVKTGQGIVFAPVVGLLVGWLLMVVVYWLFRTATLRLVGALFRRLQLVSAALYSLGHGGNDAQKTMGIILAVLIASGNLGRHEDVPFWVVISCHTAMGLGTLAGGWRIVKTMGQKICSLQPVQGFCAETGGALCLFYATQAVGVPVSTTHTITGAILGVGSARGFKSVRWRVAGRVIWAWVITIPASALAAAITWWLMDACGWKN